MKNLPVISYDQYQKIITLIKSYPKSSWTSKEISKINKSLSYIYYSLKEIFEYLNAKGPDGTNLTLVRNAEIELAKYKQKLLDITKVLNEHEIDDEN